MHDTDARAMSTSIDVDTGRALSHSFKMQYPIQVQKYKSTTINIRLDVAECNKQNVQGIVRDLRRRDNRRLLGLF